MMFMPPVFFFLCLCLCFFLQEDTALRHAVRRFPNTAAVDWKAVSELMSNRSTKQCRERWVNVLDPAISRGDWTDDEVRTLFKAQAEVGNKWAAIAARLPGRPETAVKNTFYAAVRREERRAACAAAGQPVPPPFHPSVPSVPEVAAILAEKGIPLYQAGGAGAGGSGSSALAPLSGTPKKRASSMSDEDLVTSSCPSPVLGGELGGGAEEDVFAAALAAGAFEEEPLCFSDGSSESYCSSEDGGRSRSGSCATGAGSGSSTGAGPGHRGHKRRNLSDLSVDMALAAEAEEAAAGCGDMGEGALEVPAPAAGPAAALPGVEAEAAGPCVGGSGGVVGVGAVAGAGTGGGVDAPFYPRVSELLDCDGPMSAGHSAAAAALAAAFASAAASGMEGMEDGGSTCTLDDLLFGDDEVLSMLECEGRVATLAVGEYGLGLGLGLLNLERYWEPSGVPAPEPSLDEFSWLPGVGGVAAPAGSTGGGVLQRA
jgi:hypothetical protein